MVVVGAGFSGIGTAIRLRRAGIHDFVVLERAGEVGGIWRDNTYPDVGVDIPIWGYCYSFEPNPNWRHAYAKGEELRSYAEHCVEKYGVRPHLRLDTEVSGMRFDDDRDEWVVTTSRGTYRARFVIHAFGALGRPKQPEIAGLDEFAGAVIHSARWDHEAKTSGRVAVIGTGSSAVQIIPEVADSAAELVVFQRTPIWVIPKPDFPVPRLLRWGFRRLPLLLSIPRWIVLVWLEVLYNGVFRFKLPFVVTLLERLAGAALRRQVPDPRLRERLSPSYRFGCKFLTLSNRYYRTFAREHVRLVSADIESADATGIRTADGAHHPIDTLILATGFEVFERTSLPRYPILGAGGTDLGDYFAANRIVCYEGVTLPVCPNAFIIHGPYSMTGSFFLTIENAAAHAVRCITEARRRGATRVTVTDEAFTRFGDEMIARQASSIFFNSNCEQARSFYFDRNGDVPLFRPTTSVEAWWRMRRFPLTDYVFGSRIDAARHREPAGHGEAP
ncbi:NAD(P)/FAD-dependent oxidoreductase [Nocardia stercoris]|uniref:NAD(P)/FAD-dependent oxidoreductase n=1 Tax=Nocardia stercoris TaxID=2483361 RepID=A0A3M2L7K6_9NOCA|nr:NAD(P)/FAD-dependent oxidoreductase [Nocardia stercoris]